VTNNDLGLTPLGSADPAEIGDADLVLRTRSGDRAAFAELWRRHYRSGVTVARSVTSSLDADDLVQESYTRIYDSIVSGGGPTGSFRAYLFTSIRNTAATWGRARRETAIDALDSVEDPATSEQASADALDRSLTHRAFRSLPTRWQEVLWYSEIEQMKPAEIAPLLGLKATAVAQLTFRAREGLREAWIQAHLRSVADGSDCQWTIERLGAYARMNVGRRDRVRVEAHLADCARCAIVASEAKEVSSRLALVLLPLTLGAAGTAGYLASIQGGGTAVVELAAMPSAVLPGAVTVVPVVPDFGTFTMGAAGAGTAGASTTGAGAVGAAGGGSAAVGAGAAAGSTAAGAGSLGAAASTAAAGSMAAGAASAGVAATVGAAATAGAVAAGGVLSGLGAMAGLAAAGLVVATTVAAAAMGITGLAPVATASESAPTSIVQDVASSPESEPETATATATDESTIDSGTDAPPADLPIAEPPPPDAGQDRAAEVAEAADVKAAKDKAAKDKAAKDKAESSSADPSAGTEPIAGTEPNAGTEPIAGTEPSAAPATPTPPEHAATPTPTPPGQDGSDPRPPVPTADLPEGSPGIVSSSSYVATETGQVTIEALVSGVPGTTAQARIRGVVHAAATIGEEGTVTLVLNPSEQEITTDALVELRYVSDRRYGLPVSTPLSELL
jgi:RNA polymerase sigma factor (sigma-70 family)